MSDEPDRIRLEELISEMASMELQGVSLQFEIRSLIAEFIKTCSSDELDLIKAAIWPTLQTIAASRRGND